MRIYNRCKAPIDTKWLHDKNRSYGNRIARLVIRRPNPKKHKSDAENHAIIETIPDTTKCKITICATPKMTRRDIEEVFGHELAELLLAYGEKEIVCDGFAANLIRGR